MTEMVTISKREYEDLLESQEWLNALECAGVDNWCGYDYAKDVLRDMREGNL